MNPLMIRAIITVFTTVLVLPLSEISPTSFDDILPILRNGLVSSSHKISLYSKTNFEGKYKKVIIKTTECYKLPNNFETKSIKTFETCFDLFENDNCKGEDGEVFRLDEEETDLSRLGLEKGVKSIALCFPEEEIARHYVLIARVIAWFLTQLGIWLGLGEKILSIGRAILSRIYSNEGEIKWPRAFGVKPDAANFTGRKQDLEKLHAHFNSNKTNRILLVWGLGGIGKTSLCRKFANEIFQSQHGIIRSILQRFYVLDSVSIIWLDGETIETLSESVKELEAQLEPNSEKKSEPVANVNNDDVKKPSKVFKVLAETILKKSSRLLVIIDNVDKANEDGYNEVIALKTELHWNTKAFTIVTSRNSQVLAIKDHIELGELDKDETEEMLKKSLKPSLNDLYAEDLIQISQRIPLLLQLVVAYIIQEERHEVSLADCIKKLQKNRTMLNVELDSNLYYKKTVLDIIDFAKLSEDSREIFKVVAHLDPDHIRKKILEKFCNKCHVGNFEEGLKVLRDYCFIKIDNNSISIHRFVQEVMRDKIEKIDKEYPKTLFDRMFLMTWENKKHDRASRRFNSFLPELVHLKSVYRVAWKRELETLFLDCYFYSSDKALLFLLHLDRIDCAEKVINLEFPNIQFSSKLGDKKEFIEKVLLWHVVCGDSEITSDEIVKGKFDEKLVYNPVEVYSPYFDGKAVLPHELLQRRSKISEISVKYFVDNIKITFAVKNRVIRWWTEYKLFDEALELCEEWVTFLLNDGGKFNQPEVFFETIYHIIFCLEQQFEGCTDSRIASLDKIMMHVVSKNYPNDLKEWKVLEAHWFDLKGDYEKALELFTKLGDMENIPFCRKETIEDKIIELKIKRFKMSSKEEFEKEFDMNVIETNILYSSTLRGLEQTLAIFEVNLGKDHEITVEIKMEMATRLYFSKSQNERVKFIQLCEQVLRSQIHEKYYNAFTYLCVARNINNINRDFAEQRKILEDLLKSKREDHKSANAVGKLLKWLDSRKEI